MEMDIDLLMSTCAVVVVDFVAVAVVDFVFGVVVVLNVCKFCLRRH